MAKESVSLKEENICGTPGIELGTVAPFTP